MALVCVTGASGYVGSQVALEMAKAGHSVRATTRNPDAAQDQIGALRDHVQWIAADLSDPETLRTAVAGCEFAVHTASPYVLTVDDVQRDLIGPAVAGTRAFLQAALDVGSVRRVVLTSSFAAVSDEPDGTFTESDWNDKSSPTRNPYYYSKAEAERAAWEFAASHPGLDLIVVNPSVTLGPSLIPGLNESARTLVGLVTGLFPAVLDIDYPIVDVRDVARAHRLALEQPAAHGRYLCTAETWSQRRLVDWIKGADLGLGRPPRFYLDSSLGTALAKVAARFQGAGERDYITYTIGRRTRVDTTKIRTELGVSFRPVEETLIDAYRDLERWGHLQRR